MISLALIRRGHPALYFSHISRRLHPVHRRIQTVTTNGSVDSLCQTALLLTSPLPSPVFFAALSPPGVTQSSRQILSYCPSPPPQRVSAQGRDFTYSHTWSLCGPLCTVPGLHWKADWPLRSWISDWANAWPLCSGRRKGSVILCVSSDALRGWSWPLTSLFHRVVAVE